MRILAIYRHYWPDAAPYARILRTIVEHCAAEGHETAVFTAQPTYNDVRHPRQPWREKLGGVEVRRIRLLPERKEWRVVRAINFLLFLTRAVLHAVFGRRYDLVIANSHPPVLMGCALRVIHAIRGTRYIYHCQDLHPESAALAGDLQYGRLYERLLRWDAKTCDKADRVVVLSRDMADEILARGLTLDNVSIINNPPLAADAIARPKLPPPLDDRIDTVRFLFAGNLGRFQGLERLVAAARLIAGRVPFQLIFMGEGSAKRELTALAGELLGSRIVFVPQQPLGTALAAMRVCDYGVVSLMPNVYRFAYPSKSMTYLSAGCPIVALVEQQSELAETIKNHQLGYVAPSRSVTEIAETLVKAVAEAPAWNVERRWRIENTCADLFGTKRMLAEWDRILSCVGQCADTSTGPANESKSSPAPANPIRLNPAA
jgi:glycosyltransferase involved in cell wall biosynthesis